MNPHGEHLGVVVPDPDGASPRTATERPEAAAIDRARRRFLLAVGLVGAFALLLQLALLLVPAIAAGSGIPSAIGRYFSYFTILTNLLVVLATLGALHRPKALPGRFADRPRHVAGLTSQMLIVGIVYHVALARLWNPTGWQWLADLLLHTWQPVACALYWWRYARPHPTSLGEVMPWLAYPAAYLLYALVRGSIVGEYPYPFIDLSALDAADVARNSAIVFVAFAAMLALLATLHARGGNATR